MLRKTRKTPTGFVLKGEPTCLLEDDGMLTSTLNHIEPALECGWDEDPSDIRERFGVYRQTTARTLYKSQGRF